MVKQVTKDPPGSMTGFLWVLAVFVVVTILVSPSGDFPLNDTWIYYSAVTDRPPGRYDVVDVYTSAFFYPQRIYGTLVSKTFGFSFLMLRISGILAALACLYLTYRILWRLGFDTFTSVAGTVTLLANPLFMNLSYTFMTDIPYLAFFLGAILLLVNACQNGSRAALIGGTLFTMLAISQRQTGLLLCPAALLFFFLHRRRLQPSLPEWGILLSPVIFFFLLTVVRYAGSEALPNPGLLIYPSQWIKLYNQRPLSEFSALASVNLKAIYGIVLLSVPAYLGLFVLPLLLGKFATGRRALQALPARFVPVLALCLLGVFGLQYALSASEVAGRLQVKSMPFLTNILHRCGLGPGPGDVLVGDCAPLFSPMVWDILTAVCMLGAAVLLALALLCVRGFFRGFQWKALSFGEGAPAGGSAAPVGGGLVLLGGLSQIPPIFMVWPLDRYLIPMIVPAIVLVFGSFPGIRLARGATVALLIVLGGYGLLGERDYFQWNRTRWAMARELVDRGVPLENIEAGLEWAGWHHFDRFPPGSHSKKSHPYLPWWVTGAPTLDPEYLISFSAIPGYEVSEVRSFETWLQGTPSRLYISQRIEK